MCWRGASVCLALLVHQILLLQCAHSLLDVNQTESDLSRTAKDTGATIEFDLNGQPKKQSAPYAIEHVQDQPEASGPLRSLLFRLTLNDTGSSAANVPAGRQQVAPHVSRTISSLNGSILANLDLRRLIETLESNNLSSEIQQKPLAQPMAMAAAEPATEMVDITISSNQQLGKDSLTSIASALDELVAESRSLSANASLAVLRDNHRFLDRYPQRVRPATAGLELLSAAATAPPIRRIHEQTAENYTVRKIADEANNFALKLLNQLNIEQLGSHNIIQSPFAVYQGLGLLMSGAHGDTWRELDRVLLGAQSIQENTKLTHDHQELLRLLASYGEIMRHLYKSSTNHFVSCRVSSAAAASEPLHECDRAHSKRAPQYRGGTEDQHLILANSLLFSPEAHEIAPEFKTTIAAYYNNTELARVEPGSTESVQVVNNWIRQATLGFIPALLRKTQTFDEYNTMTLLSTSWLSQEWRDPFRRISSPVRSSVRLRGQLGPAQTHGTRQYRSNFGSDSLLEFIEDSQESHFVEYIKSAPTRNIHHYHSVLSGQPVDMVVVPFRDSNQRFVALTPMNHATHSQQQQQQQQQIAAQQLNAQQSTNEDLAPGLNQSSRSMDQNGGSDAIESWNASGQASSFKQALPTDRLHDSSQLTKLISIITSNPRRAMKTLWNTIAPEIITKQNYQSMQIAIGQQMANLSSAFVVPPLVSLSLPLIRDQADVSLTAPLNHMGLVGSFDPAQANFIGINGHPFNYHKLHLSNVIYKTKFNLNEYGINYDQTVRTLQAMRVLPQNKWKIQWDQFDNKDTSNEIVDEVKLNKPFIYMICDIKTRLVLYTGIIRNPAKEAFV